MNTKRQCGWAFKLRTVFRPDLDPLADHRPTSIIAHHYLDPPAGALVLSIDEKTSIQAKGLARPDSLPAPGKPARRDYEYTRNGTMNLFAALRVHSGETHAMTSQTRNRFDLIRFLEEIEQTIPPAAGRQIIAIMDNLSTHHSHDVKAWLRGRRPRWPAAQSRVGRTDDDYFEIDDTDHATGTRLAGDTTRWLNHRRTTSGPSSVCRSVSRRCWTR